MYASGSDHFKNLFSGDCLRVCSLRDDAPHDEATSAAQDGRLATDARSGVTQSDFPEYLCILLIPWPAMACLK